MKCCTIFIENALPMIKSPIFSTSLIFFLLTATSAPLVCSYGCGMTLVLQLIKNMR